MTRVDRLAGPHRVVYGVGGRGEIERADEAGEESLAGFFPDSHSAVALHVAVSAHRAKTCPGASDIAAQQHEVDDLLDRRHGIPMLRQSHGPATDDRLGAHGKLRCLTDLLATQAAELDDPIPAL